MDKKMFKVGYFIGVLLIVGVALYVYFDMPNLANDAAIPKIELTQLDLQQLDGEKVQFKTEKPIVLNFWATWCVPCVEEFPEFEELNKKYGDKVDFLMVSDESILKIDKFKAKHKYTLNLIRSLKTFDEFGLMLRPATYIYDAKGNLVQKIVGGVTKQELESEIEKLIANK